MDAKEFVNQLRSQGSIVKLRLIRDEKNCGAGTGVVIDGPECMAVLVTDVGNLPTSRIPRGAIVRYSDHPEASEYKIIEPPAFAEEFQVRNESPYPDPPILYFR